MGTSLCDVFLKNLQFSVQKERKFSDVPLTHPYRDAKGRILMLWKSIQHDVYGTVTNVDGKTTFISSTKILNPLNSKYSFSNLQKISSIGIRQWDLAYLETYGTITIWPRMLASGKDNTFPFEIRFPEKTDQFLHIFNQKKPWGHFSRATEERKNLLIEMFSDPANRVAIDKYENHIYFKTLPNGEQLWGELRPDGLINDAGRNLLHKKWVPTSDPENKRGGSYRYIQGYCGKCFGAFNDPRGGDFKDRLQTNNLVDSYNACHPNHPMARGKATSGQIGGVGNEVGIILGLFDGIQAQFETEHAFFFPTPDGFSLSTEEIQRILHELAVGIFVHDTVPFFSLHFNGDANMYPVIHPAYQNTFVGYVISMLDYYMKGFLNGGFFDAAFIEAWNTNPKMDEKTLKSHIIDMQKYCKEHLNSVYMPLKQWVDMLEREASHSADEDPLLTDYSAFRSSFRIIAYQESIHKTENLLLPNGDFQVLYTLTPDPVYAEELAKYRQRNGRNPPSYERLEKVYQGMCVQIKTQMPRLPLFKKLFEALQIINFFCYYFNTLKAANKIPLLNRKVFDTLARCPPLFPHLPLRGFYSQKIAIHPKEILNEEQKSTVGEAIKTAITEEQKQKVIETIAEAIKNHTMRAAIFPLSDKQKEISTYKPRATAIFNSYKMSYQLAEEKILRTIEREIQKNTEERKQYEIVESWWLGIILSAAEPRKYQLYRKMLQVLDKSLQAMREQRDKITKDPFSFFQLSERLVNMELLESVLHLYSEQKEEQQRHLQKRVVGGCGIHLERKSLQVDPIGYSILNQLSGPLSQLQWEEILETGNNTPSGILFKLRAFS